MANTSNKNLIAAHFVAGFFFIFLSFKLFNQKHFIDSYIFIITGISFIAITGLHKWIIQRTRKISVLFLLIESGTFFYAAYIMEHKSKMAALLLGIATIIYLILFLIFFTEKKRKRYKKSSSV